MFGRDGTGMDDPLRLTDPAAGRQGRNEIKLGDIVVVTGLLVHPDFNGKTGVTVQYIQSVDRWRILMSEDGSKKTMKSCNLIPLAPSEPLVSLLARSDASAAYAGLSYHSTQLPDADVADPRWQPSSAWLEGRSSSSAAYGTGHTHGGVRLHYVQDANHCEIRLEVGSEGSLEQIMMGQSAPAVGNTLALSVSEAAANFSRASQQLAEALAAGKHIEPGERVRVKGLQRSAQVNNQLGTAVEWCATLKRWKVRLDSGRAVTIKPQNLDLCNLSVVKDFAVNNGLHRDPSFRASAVDPLTSSPDARMNIVML